MATSGFCGPDLCLLTNLSFPFLLALGVTPGLLTFSACVLSLCHPPSNSLDSGARLLRFASQLCHVLCVAIRSHLSFLSLRSLTCGMELREVSAFAVVVGGLSAGTAWEQCVACGDHTDWPSSLLFLTAPLLSGGSPRPAQSSPQLKTRASYSSRDIPTCLTLQPLESRVKTRT